MKGEKGTTFVKGLGIVREGFKYPPPWPTYCMKSVPLGGDCSNKFSTVRAQGSFCINAKKLQARELCQCSLVKMGSMGREDLLLAFLASFGSGVIVAGCQL